MLRMCSTNWDSVRWDQAPPAFFRSSGRETASKDLQGILQRIPRGMLLWLFTDCSWTDGPWVWTSSRSPEADMLPARLPLVPQALRKSGHDQSLEQWDRRKFTPTRPQGEVNPGSPGGASLPGGLSPVVKGYNTDPGLPIYAKSKGLAWGRYL